MSTIIHQDSLEKSIGSQELTNGKYLEWGHQKDNLLLSWSCTKSLSSVLGAIRQIHNVMPDSRTLRNLNGPLVLNSPAVPSDKLADIVFYREDFKGVSYIWEQADEHDEEYPHAELSLMLARQSILNMKGFFESTASSGVILQSEEIFSQLILKNLH